MPKQPIERFLWAIIALAVAYLAIHIMAYSLAQFGKLILLLIGIS